MKKIYLQINKLRISLLALSLLLSAGFAQAQENSITGVVTDSTNGQTMPGVAVMVKGTSRGVVTDIDGKYKINASAQEVLVFAFMSYKSQEVPVGSQTQIDVALAPDMEQLSDVVVVGYGTIEKKDATGAVTSVTDKEFNKGVLVSPKQLISGKIAGVQISNDGSPRGGAQVRIRGGSTFGGNSDPLYVIDGVPMAKTAGHSEGGQDPLSFINPADIENITVLKDASAAAIYGVQGASGVILITTKSGTKGKLKLSYNGQYGVSVNQAFPEMLSTEEFRFLVGEKAPRELGKLGDANTNWADEVTRLARSTTHSVTAMMGGKTNNLRMSLNYVDNAGVLVTDRTQRITPSVKYTQRLLNDDLTLTASYNGTYNWDRLAPNVMKDALAFAPTQPIYAPEDSLNGGYFEWANPLGPVNPVSSINQNFNQNRAWRHFASVVAEYKIPFVDGLSVKANLGYDRNVSRVQNVTLPTLRPANSEFPGNIFYSKAVTTTQTYEVFMNYKKRFNRDHKIDAIAGHSFQDFVGEYPNLRKQEGILYEDLQIGNPLTYVNEDFFDNNLNLFLADSNNITIYRLASLWGRVNYGFKDRYLFTATLRYDGSSRFGPDNNFNVFPSFAFAWRAIDEPFLQPLTNVFSELKLRVGYGITGNQEISREFGYVDLYALGNPTAQYILGNDTVQTLRPSGANPGIQWEETTSINFGVDFGLLKGRLNGSLEYYHKTTDGLLFDVTWPIGPLTTFREFANIGSFTVDGVELALSAIAIDQKDLRWTVDFNATWFTDEITSVDFSNDPNFLGYQTTGISGDVGQTIQVIQLGQRNNTFFVYEHKRNAAGNPVTDSEDTNGDGLTDLRDIYVDQNGDGNINELDLRPYKNASPDVIFGLTSNLSYKKWSLSFTLRSQIGNYVYNNLQSEFGAWQTLQNNGFGPRNVHVNAFTNDFNNRQLLSDIYIENASFLRMDNISLGYNFMLSPKLRANAFVTATNLFVITGYSGIDPEVGINGVDNNPYPRARTFLIGANISF